MDYKQEEKEKLQQFIENNIPKSKRDNLIKLINAAYEE